MAALPARAVTDYFAQQRALSSEAFRAVLKQWLSIGSDFDAGWPTVGPRITLLTASAQLGAARNAATYVPAALSLFGTPPPPDAEIAPGAFSGFASDGRPLGSLLYGSVVSARSATVDTLAERLAIGANWLQVAVTTQVADAGRQATGAGIAARPRTGYVRETGPKCCSRCAVMAGKFFRYNTGFLRHPSCQCVHVPVTLSGSRRGLTSTPTTITGLTKAERKALDDGADLSQVVNARRGASGMTTTEGTTKRGLAYGELQGKARLTPDGIYRIASDREEAVQLLTAQGYLA